MLLEIPAFITNILANRPKFAAIDRPFRWETFGVHRLEYRQMPGAN